MKDQRTLSVRIHCHNLPGARFEEKTAVRLGIQRGRDVIDDVPADVRSVTFTATVGVVDTGTGTPDYRGPYVHGKPGERFLYLNWGERRDGEWEGFRRAKIRFDTLDPDLVARALDGDSAVETALDVTDEKGGPLCASVRAERIRWTVGEA